MIQLATNLLNKIIFFFTGLMINAIFFLLILKLLSGWGIFVALIIGFSVNYWLKKTHQKSPLLNSLNNGFLTFNIITTLTGLLAYILFFSAMQNLLN